MGKASFLNLISSKPAPPAKAGGFGLRLEKPSLRHTLEVVVPREAVVPTPNEVRGRELVLRHVGDRPQTEKGRVVF